MRFITEFELSEKDNNDKGYRKVVLFNQKANRQIEMGEMLAKSLGWQNPVNGNELHHRLEIEAFPMEKWIEFKNELFVELSREDTPNQVHILNLIKELESFGKPPGDTITNPPVIQSGNKYYFDPIGKKVFKDNGDGKIEDITNPK